MDVLKVLGPETLPFRSRKPRWFKVPAPGGERYRELDRMIRSEGLHTVCQEAACPNVGDCWERGTATFMILGDTVEASQPGTAAAAADLPARDDAAPSRKVRHAHGEVGVDVLHDRAAAVAGLGSRAVHRVGVDADALARLRGGRRRERNDEEGEDQPIHASDRKVARRASHRGAP